MQLLMREGQKYNKRINYWFILWLWVILLSDWLVGVLLSYKSVASHYVAFSLRTQTHGTLTIQVVKATRALLLGNWRIWTLSMKARGFFVLFF